MKKFLINVKSPHLFSLYHEHSTFHKGDSGLDLFFPEDVVIGPGETMLVDLGVSCQLKTLSLCPWKWIRGKFWNYHSYFLMPRSSIYKTPLMMKNSLGLIDKGYTGNLKVPLYNTSDEPFHIKRGQRCVQIVSSDLSEICFQLVTSLRRTSRGENGFGSTGN